MAKSVVTDGSRSPVSATSTAERSTALGGLLPQSPTIVRITV